MAGYGYGGICNGQEAPLEAAKNVENQKEESRSDPKAGSRKRGCRE